MENSQHAQDIQNVKIQNQLQKQQMYLAQNVEQQYKLEKQKGEKNISFAENNPQSCDYISWNKPQPGEKWNPEDAEKVKDETTVKKTTTKKAKKAAKTKK